jgi:ABC-type Fe3+ transport system permease subunit
LLGLILVAKARHAFSASIQPLHNDATTEADLVFSIVNVWSSMAATIPLFEILRLQPDLDEAADGLGASGLILLTCGPGVDIRHEFVG